MKDETDEKKGNYDLGNNLDDDPYGWIFTKILLLDAKAVPARENIYNCPPGCLQDSASKAQNPKDNQISNSTLAKFQNSTSAHIPFLDAKYGKANEVSNSCSC